MADPGSNPTEQTPVKADVEAVTAQSALGGKSIVSPVKVRIQECEPSLLWLLGLGLVCLVWSKWGCNIVGTLCPEFAHSHTVYLAIVAAMFGAGGATVRVLYAVLRDQETMAAGKVPDNPADQEAPAVIEAQTYVHPMMMPLVGGFLAMVFELVASADLGITIPQNGHAVAAWGAIIGIFFPQAMDKLKAVADALFGAESEGASAPVTSAPAPPSAPVPNPTSGGGAKP